MRFRHLLEDKREPIMSFPERVTSWRALRSSAHCSGSYDALLTRLRRGLTALRRKKLEEPLEQRLRDYRRPVLSSQRLSCTHWHTFGRI